MMDAEIRAKLGVCRKKHGSREYYDCPRCTVKDPIGQLVVSWDIDKFVCNHCDSCGFRGTISKSLSYELGIRKNMNTHIDYKPQQDEPKTVYAIGDLTPVVFKIESDPEKYDPSIDRTCQIRALFASNSQLVTCIDSQYGNLISIGSEALIEANENHTHFKVNAGGAKAEDIKDYRYTLIECDEIADMSIQGAYIKQLGFPVASLTWSGNKSLHAVLKIEADTHEEYKRRVDLVHEVCASVGFKIDNTKDCCRFTRLAGGINTKTNYYQCLLEVNTGARDWNQWELEVLPRLIKTENVVSSSDIKMRDIQSGYSSGFATHDYNDSGLKGGTLTLLTGARNQGKTTFSRQIVIACANQGQKAFVWYGEGDKEYEKGYLVRLIARKDEIITQDNKFCRVTWKANEKAEKRFDEHLGRLIDMYIKPLSLPVPVFDDLMSRMTDKVRQGARLVVIDNMMKLTADQRNTFDAQKRIIAKLKEFADYYDIHIILIAHPRKGEGDQSISGALEQENTADTILRFKRVFSADSINEDRLPMSEKDKVTAVVTIEKVRNDGADTNMYMEFDKTRQANIEIAYLEEIQEMAEDYAEGGMFSRPVTPNCEDLGGVNVNGIKPEEF